MSGDDQVGPAGYFVQVRFHGGGDWQTVAVGDTRMVAASRAGRAYRALVETRGARPSSVRVIAGEELRRAGGEPAIERAVASLGQLASELAG